MILIMILWALNSKVKESFTKFGVKNSIRLLTFQLAMLAFT